jgi:diguanylate cyclase (GGDEF)-like protein
VSDRTTELALLKAFEGALKEGLLLDETLGGILGASLHFFDAPVVALLPGPGVPPMVRSGHSAAAPATEGRLSQHLEEILSQGRAKKTIDGGVVYVGAPVRLKEQTQAAFGVALPASAPIGDVEEAVRLFARTVGHVLERDRTLSTLMKRREEAVALFELASGAFLSLNPEEVIRLTVSSLSRELEFDRVQAFRFIAETREIEELTSQGPPPSGAVPRLPTGRRSIESDDLLLRCFSAHGPVFEDEATPAGMPARRKRMALPLHAGDAVFGFLTMSRRGGFALTAQELRLAQELAKLAAGALEKARLLESQRLDHERSAFVSRVHGALSGLSDVVSIVRRTVEDVGPHFDLDFCAIRILSSGELPGAQAVAVKGGGGDATVEIPDALLAHLSTEGSRIFLPDVSAESIVSPLLPRGPALSRLPPPLAFIAVPIAYRGMPVGVLCGLAAGRSRGLPPSVLAAFDDLAVEISLAVASVRLLQQERDSHRFLDSLREAGRSLATTFDLARIKQTLCEQCVALLGVDAAQFWDADAPSKSLQLSARWGADVGDTAVRPVSPGDSGHAVVRAFLDRAPRVASGREAAAVFPGASRLAVVPLLYHEEPVGVLTVAVRRGDDFTPEFRGRLDLVADAGTVALHNARLMRLIEQQAERDGQTGLCNRVSLVKRLESEIRRAERNGQSIAVAHLRLDGLADSMARLEPGVADALLSKVASRLVRSTRAVNLVARDQADRFWILIFEATKVQAHRAVRAIQKNFEAQLDARLEPAGIRFALTTGVSVYPDDAFDTSALLACAEEALEEAIRTGPASVVLCHGPAEADSSVPA